MSIFPSSLLLVLLLASELGAADRVKLGIDVLLAGDALQALSFELVTKTPVVKNHPTAVMVLELARTAGSLHLVGGQVADLEGAEGIAAVVHLGRRIAPGRIRPGSLPDSARPALRRDMPSNPVVRLESAGCLTALGDSVATHAALLRGEVALQLRPGVFRQGPLTVQLLAPRGEQDPRLSHHDGSRRRSACTGITMRRMTTAAATKMPGVGTCLSWPRSL